MTWPPSGPDCSLDHLESSRLHVHYPNPELPGSGGGLTRTKRPLSPSLIKVFLPQSGSACSVHSGLSPWKGPQRTSSLALSRSERETEASSVQTTLMRGGPGRGRAEGVCGTSRAGVTRGQQVLPSAARRQKGDLGRVVWILSHLICPWSPPRPAPFSSVTPQLMRS